MMRFLNKIIWAVDALPESVELSSQAVVAIRGIASALPTEIQPVYVVRPSQYDLDRGQFLLKGKELPKEIEKTFNEIISVAMLPKVHPLKICVAEGNSLRQTVKALIDYSVQQVGSMIVLSTHARKGMPRLFLGSFTETLILESPLPVLITNPMTKTTYEKIQNIIFATDFSERSREAFEDTLELASQINAKVYLFNKLNLNEYYGVSIFALPELMMTGDHITKERKQLAEEWIEEAKTKKVEIKFFMSRSNHDVSGALVRIARRLPSCLIAMASQSSPIATALLGSTTRQVIRSAKCPVLVIHPALAAESKMQTVALLRAMPAVQ